MKLTEPTSYEHLCLCCPLADCNDSSQQCLIQIALQADPVERERVRYREWRANNMERKRQLNREYSKRKREAKLNNLKSARG